MYSNDRFCQVVAISYLIEVEAEASGMHLNQKIRLPITIGTVPLRFDNQSETLQMVQPSAPIVEQRHDMRTLNFCY